MNENWEKIIICKNFRKCESCDRNLEAKLKGIKCMTLEEWQADLEARITGQSAKRRRNDIQ